MVHVDQVFSSKTISINANKSLDFHIVSHFPMAPVHGRSLRKSVEIFKVTDIYITFCRDFGVKAQKVKLMSMESSSLFNRNACSIHTMHYYTRNTYLQKPFAFISKHSFHMKYCGLYQHRTQAHFVNHGNTINVFLTFFGQKSTK